MSRAKPGEEARSKVYSVRSKPSTHSELTMLGNALGIPAAEFADQLIEEGINRYTDPQFLDAYIAQRTAALETLRSKISQIADARKRKQ